MDALYLVAVVVVVAISLYLGLLRLIRSQHVAIGTYEALKSERDRLSGELAMERDLARSLLADKSRLEAQNEALKRIEVDAAAARQVAQETQVALQTSQQALASNKQSAENYSRLLEVANGEVSALRSEMSDLREKHVKAMANLEQSSRANEEIKNFLAEAKDRLATAFTELAGKSFESATRNVAQQSKGDIETLLKPFAERVDEFRKRVDVLYTDEARERAALFGAVNELRHLNQDMATRAMELTRALKGSAKVRGDWGELMLDSVLQNSGLEEGVHYDRQKRSTNDEGQSLQPDIVVRLPDDRRIVVDSKVNLIAWQEAMNAEHPEAQNDAMRRHAVALRQHVKDLGDRNYPKSIGDAALEVTIAFVPIEGALSAALGIDDTLQTFAFNQKVVFASPNTLMAVLRVIDRLWTREKIQRQAIEISDAGGRVLDALIAFLTDFDLVGRRLGEATYSFNNARNRLSESRHSVIPRARRLAELGVRGRRALTNELVPETATIPIQADDLLGTDESPAD